MKKISFITSIITILFSFMILAVVSFAWFSESYENAANFEGTVYTNDSDGFTVTDPDSVTSEKEVNLTILPGQYVSTGFKVDVNEESKLDFSFVEINVDKTLSEEESAHIHKEELYKGTKLFNKTTNNFYQIATEESYKGFVSQADVRNAIEYSVILTTDKFETENLTSTSEVVNVARGNSTDKNILALKTLDETIDEVSLIDKIITADLEAKTYYCYVVLYFSPFVYPEISIEGQTYYLDNSNPFMFQTLRIGFMFNKQAKGA